MATPWPATHAGPSWDEEVVPALRKLRAAPSHVASQPSPSPPSKTPPQSTHPPVAKTPPRARLPIHCLSLHQIATTAATLNGYHPTQPPIAQCHPRPPHTTLVQTALGHSSSLVIQETTTRSSYFPTLKNLLPALHFRILHPPRRKDGIKPTRIPVASRPSNASSASLIHAIASTSTSPPPPLPTTTTTDQSTASSKSSILPPFNSISTGTSSIAMSYIPAEQPPRASTDSEERPFEHWYRVGELRVGKRQEMLDIANYGHQKALAISRGRRKRADSIAGLTKKERERGSESESVKEFGAFSRSRGRAYSEEEGAGAGDVFDSLPAQILDSYHPEARSPTPTQASIRKSSMNGTRIPRRSSESHGATSTPSPSPPPITPAASSSSTPKLHAKSPNSTPGKKKPQQKKAAPKRVEEEDQRDDEDGEQEDLKDAIPSWTQPVRQGNWEKCFVVLPVVARQKGLNGLYETADGSPQPKKIEQAIAPAPGTFGYDHTKYRPPRNHPPLSKWTNSAGRTRPHNRCRRTSSPPPQMSTYTSAHDNTQLPVRSKQPMPQEKPKPKVRPVDPSELGLDLDARTSAVAVEGRQVEKMQVEEAEVEGGAGCCKCVIM
ncbi:hypothetical protein BDQ17DRAFT_1353152 [Cyathus striatus]|nr:hypothetical protein BDQ17DRAFT_1353152 [Cyathus striatus]